MKKRTLKRGKRYSAIHPYFCIEMLAGFLLIVPMLMIWVGYIAHDFYIENNGDLTVWCLVIMVYIAFAIIYIIFAKHRTLDRYLMGYRFSEEGIHCSGLGWGRFVVTWDSIHTYGYFDNSVSVYGIQMFFFSQDPKELYKKKDLDFRRDRLILQYRPEIWQAACEHMPEDMKKRLEECLRRNRDGFFKR